MKFPKRGVAHVVAIHSQHKTNEAARVRESPLNVWPLLGQSRMIHSDKTDVIRARIEAQLPQPISIQRFRYFFRWKFSPMRCNRGMLFDWGVHKSLQLKLFAQAPVEHSRRNKSAQPAQGNSLANRIMQSRGLRAQRSPHSLRDDSRIVAMFHLSFREF